MAITVADQAMMPCTVSTGGTPAAYAFGDILPAASTSADLAVRAYLRGSGVLRAVTVTTTSGDFTTAVTTAATAQATREAATAYGSPTPGKPVASCPGELPVVANY